jgi:hypothetical protein
MILDEAKHISIIFTPLEKIRNARETKEDSNFLF